MNQEEINERIRRFWGGRLPGHCGMTSPASVGYASTAQCVRPASCPSNFGVEMIRLVENPVRRINQVVEILQLHRILGVYDAYEAWVESGR